MFVRQHWPAFSTYFQTIYFRLYIIKSFVKLMKPKLVMSYRIVTPQFQGKHIPVCTGCSIAHSHGEGGGGGSCHCTHDTHYNITYSVLEVWYNSENERKTTSADVSWIYVIYIIVKSQIISHFRKENVETARGFCM